MGSNPVNSLDKLDARDFSYSLVVPVFNSEAIVGTTVDRIVETFDKAGLKYEVILINDGSRDGSWEVIAEKARTNPHVIALDMLRNYGQHNANLAGMREATGDYVITLDDDLQNPPDQALVLIDVAMAGHDVVFGEFDHKAAAGYRRIGSQMISTINRKIFAQPPDLTVSNFRILRRDVVDRICASHTTYPYITGQALLYSSNRANARVRHEPRPVGKSQYSLRRIVKLVFTILFSYSSWPLHATATAGFAVAGIAFVIGIGYLLRGLVFGSNVEGWTSLIVLLAIFNGCIIGMLSMLGEYVVRTLNMVADNETYHLVRRVTST